MPEVEEDIHHTNVSEDTATVKSGDDSHKKLDDWFDILGGGRLFKKTLTEGTGPRPDVSSGVRMNYKYRPVPSLDLNFVRNLDEENMGWVYDSQTSSDHSMSGNEHGLNCEFRVGEGDTLGALDLIVSLMREGEKAYVLAAAAYCWGDHGMIPMIKADTNILFYIDFEKITHDPANMAEMTEMELVQIAEQKKNRGNYLLKRGELDGAIKSYIQALRIVSHKNEDDEDEEMNQDDVKIVELDDDPSATKVRMEEGAAPDGVMFKLHMAILNNLAQAHLVIGDTEKARKICDEALEMDGNNVKALYRSGCVWMATKDYGAAVINFKRLLEHDSGNIDAAKKLKLANSFIKKEQDAEKKLFAAMMGQNGKNGKTGTKGKGITTPVMRKSSMADKRRESADKTNQTGTLEKSKPQSKKEKKSVKFDSTATGGQEEVLTKKDIKHPTSNPEMDWFVWVYSSVVVIVAAVLVYKIYYMKKMGAASLYQKYQ
eukprot:CFRG2727T1